MEKNTFKDVTLGRLARKGIQHFVSRDELFELLSLCGFIDIQIDSVLRTDNTKKIEEFIAIAKK